MEAEPIARCLRPPAGGDAPSNPDPCSAALSSAGKDLAGVLRADADWATISTAASANNISPALLASIGIRETDFSNIPQNGGSGMGVFQLTNQPGVSAAQAYNLPFAANYAAGLLASNGAYLAGKFPAFTPQQLLQATAASYNMDPYKPGNFTGNPDTIDIGTTGNNYGATVVALMACFKGDDEILTGNIRVNAHIAAYSQLLCTIEQ